MHKHFLLVTAVAILWQYLQLLMQWQLTPITENVYALIIISDSNTHMEDCNDFYFFQYFGMTYDLSVAAFFLDKNQVCLHFEFMQKEKLLFINVLILRKKIK